jgi:hypothetical protein
MEATLKATLERMAIYPILVELEACLCQRLDQNQVCYCGILVGDEIPVDLGDECGITGYVRVISAFPSQNFPQPDSIVPDNTVRAFQINVGIVRVAPQMEGDGNPPAAEDIRLHALQKLADQQLTWEAIMCCITDKFEDAQIANLAYTPLPNNGGIDGGEWSFLIEP